MVFQWSLSESKSPQVFRTLLSILSDLYNAVVCMVSICPPISNRSSPFTKPLGIVPSAPITIGITVTFVSHSLSFLFFSFFFGSLAKSKYLSLFSLSLILTLRSIGTVKSTGQEVGFFFRKLSLGLVVWLGFDDLF